MEPTVVPSPAPVVSGANANARRNRNPNPGAGAGLATIGFLTMLLGAWAGIVPFVGPEFGFNATGTGAWVWNLSHAVIWLVGGGAAVLLGLMMMSAAPFARRGMAKIGPIWAGFLVACSGAWLAIGPFAWRVLDHSVPIRPAGALHELAYWVGCSLGPGVLLGLLGGIAMGVAMMTRPGTQVPVAETASQTRIAA